MLAGMAVSANASGFQCTAGGGVPLTVRADGFTEMAGDLTLSCTGGTPTPAGQAFPQFNFTVLISTNVTSRVTAENQFAEALLIVDEPGSASNPTRPILNCGNSGAPDNGTPGPGVVQHRQFREPGFELRRHAQWLRLRGLRWSGRQAVRKYLRMWTAEHLPGTDRDARSSRPAQRRHLFRCSRGPARKRRDPNIPHYEYARQRRLRWCQHRDPP